MQGELAHYQAVMLVLDASIQAGPFARPRNFAPQCTDSRLEIPSNGSDALYLLRWTFDPKPPFSLVQNRQVNKQGHRSFALAMNLLPPKR